VSQARLDRKIGSKTGTKTVFRRTIRRLSSARSRLVVSAWLLLVLHPLFAQDVPTHPWPVRIAAKVLGRLLVPFRSNPFSQSSISRCGLGLASCRSSASAAPTRAKYDFSPAGEDPSRPAILEVRTDHGGPLAHHWLELDSPDGELAFGFGPATLPFIDSGEISLEDRYGNTKWVSGMHPLPWLALPPVKYSYARTPGEGHILGKPIPLTMAQADALTSKMLHVRFVGPYIPIFHDCRTYTCSVLASAQGHSTLPCYLLFKGYW
jgi:hypothetical protein